MSKPLGINYELNNIPVVLVGPTGLPLPAGYTVDSNGYLVDGSNNKFIYLKFADGKYWLGADGNYLFGRAP
jgi:hypothetical protein